MTTVNFTVHHVARIEGHGNIVVNARDGKIEEVNCFTETAAGRAGAERIIE